MPNGHNNIGFHLEIVPWIRDRENSYGRTVGNMSQEHYRPDSEIVREGAPEPCMNFPHMLLSSHVWCSVSPHCMINHQILRIESAGLDIGTSAKRLMSSVESDIVEPIKSVSHELAVYSDIIYTTAGTLCGSDVSCGVDMDNAMRTLWSKAIDLVRVTDSIARNVREVDVLK
jgi:hypothetical protein